MAGSVPLGTTCTTVSLNTGDIMSKYNSGSPEDDAEAVRWFRMAAEQGHAEAQFNLGLMYAEGRGVPEDHAAAVDWYRMAAKQGHAGAMTNLGVMYAEGRGVTKDDMEATRWFLKAAVQVQTLLGLKLGFRDVPEAYTEAIRLFHMTGEQLKKILGADEDCTFVYGFRVHPEVRGVDFNLRFWNEERKSAPESDAAAGRWFRRAAEQGGAALFHPELGLRYAWEREEYVPLGCAATARWHRMATSQGQAEAQFRLGLMYSEAAGAPGHDAKMRWYRMAADQELFLGLKYACWEGASKNRLQAYVWLNIAVSQGEEAAEVEAKKLAEHMICTLLADVAQNRYGKYV